MTYLATLVLVLGLAGCASAPKTQRPQLDLVTPQHWTALPQVSADTLWQPAWDDTLLQALLDEALQRNYNLAVAATRVQTATAQARIAGADLKPQVRLDGSGAKRKQNFIGFPIPGAGGAQVQSTTSNTFNASLNISWEVDLWGRLRAGQRAALADLQASAADLRGARLSLVARTARAFYAAVEARRQVELGQQTVANYKLSSDQTRNRYQNGLVSALDWSLAQANQARAEANLHQRRRQADAALRQLEVLLGRYPAAQVAIVDDLPQIARAVPAGLPADLVARRPDLVAAERRLAAADQRLVQARRALYPRISLTASGGRSSSELGDLLDGDFSVWSLLANLSQPLLQGGRLRAQIQQADAGADAALATYAQTVLNAYAEVESLLAGTQYLAQQERAMATAAAHALISRQLAEERYARGVVDFVTMLSAQRSAFDSESQLLTVRRLQLESYIDLHLALGGGFGPLDAPIQQAEN